MLSLHRSLRPLHIYASPLLVASLPLARATTYNLHHPVFCQSQLGRVKPIKQDIPLNQSLERGDEVGRKGWFGGLVERFKDALRVLELTFVFVPLGILYVPCRCLGEGLERRWRALLVLTLQHFGPTFIKFGQWASTRADLFSAELRTAFANSLASNNAAQPFHVIKRTVCDAFHVDTLDQAFEEFAPEPIGAGCVAQVHKAKVRGRKRPVAVKVISGNVLEVLQRDLRILARVSWLLQLVLPEEFGLRNIVSQFGELMTKQVDLRIEARHLARFRDNFAKVDEVEFPEVVTVSSNGKVLVESFEQGVLLSELLASHATSAPDSPLRSQHLRKQIADVGLKCFLQMVLVDNFVHSDLHPGNIIVRLKDDGAAKFESISVIDAGLVTTLSPSNKRNFIDLFLAVAHGDGEEAGRLMITRSSVRKSDSHSFTANENRFIEGMEEVVSQHGARNFSLDKVKFGEVLQSVLGLVYSCRVPIDTNFSNLVLSFIVAEGILRQLDSSLNIFSVALPLLYRMDPVYKEKAKSAFYDVAFK